MTETELSIRRFTSSEAGAWSNSYLISDASEAVLYDVFMLRSDTLELARQLEQSSKNLTTVMISHAHPDHFMGLEVIADRFPKARIVSTADVVADIRQDGPWMFDMLRRKLGAEGPARLVIPEPLAVPSLQLGGVELSVLEFAEGETKHLACIYIAAKKALLTADMIYNDAHLYLAEKHLASWLERLDELQAFTEGRVSTLYPGHGAVGDVNTLIAKTRAYLHDFAEAIESGDVKSAERQLLAQYPDHHIRQFLTVFSLPAYFLAPRSN
jgi:glyoxylase-like metal-dependent hydrolase (beta-lactamase superfamily II)